MKKTLLVFLSTLLLIGVFSESVAAKDINSYELFWPLVAGKTMGDSMYFAKTLNENFKGLIIFDSSQKLDYEILLATKRVIEAEKLIDEKKVDLAGKSLDQAGKWLDKGATLLGKAKMQKKEYQIQSVNILNRLTNLTTFLPWLASKAGDNKASIEEVLERVILLKSKL